MQHPIVKNFDSHIFKKPFVAHTNTVFCGCEGNFSKHACFAELKYWLRKSELIYSLLFNGWGREDAPIKLDNKAILNSLSESFAGLLSIEVLDEDEHGLLISIDNETTANKYYTTIGLFLHITRLMDFEMLSHWCFPVYKNLSDPITDWQSLVYHYIHDVSFYTCHGFLTQAQSIHNSKSAKRYRTLTFIAELEDVIGIIKRTKKNITTEGWISNRIKQIYKMEEN